jgi:hypothetical protein
MKNGLRIALVFGFGAALLQVTAAAESQPASTNAPAVAPTNAPVAAPKLSPAEQKEKWSYAIGMNIGNGVKRGAVDLDVDVIAGAI